MSNKYYTTQEGSNTFIHIPDADVQFCWPYGSKIATAHINTDEQVEQVLEIFPNAKVSPISNAVRLEFDEPNYVGR